MRKIIIASHHNLAKGLKDTINYIVPNTFDMIAISAYVNNDPIETEVKKALDDIGVGDEAIVFTDLLGGSVNQAFVPHLLQDNIHVITGMNVPLILTLLLSLNDQKVSKEQIQHAITDSQKQIIYVNDYIKEQSIDEDDE